MKAYTDLAGRPHDLTALDSDERRLLTRLKQLSERSDFEEYRNRSLREIAAFYEERGLSRSAIVRTAVYKVAQDLARRMQVALGKARAPDYRDQLEELIRTSFPTRRAFCKATGLSEDMLSHVLSRRKHLSVDRLSDALERIGYSLTISRLAKTR